VHLFDWRDVDARHGRSDTERGAGDREWPRCTPDDRRGRGPAVFLHSPDEGDTGAIVISRGAAGICEELITKHDVLELAPVTSEAYYVLKKDGASEQLLGKSLLLGDAAGRSRAEKMTPDQA
jgi:hypothetical protein